MVGTALEFDDRIELDVWYVDHRTTLLDLRIMRMTLVQVIARRDVSETQDPAAVGFPLSDTPAVDAPDRRSDAS